VRADRLDVRVADVHELPFPDATFDRVLTVNTVYFWPDLQAALAEIRRILRPGGRLVIGIRDPKQMRRVSRDIFTVREPREVRDAVAAAGFGDVALESPPDRALHFIVAAGRA
jgi:SAM-dependent methyltransferase